MNLFRRGWTRSISTLCFLLAFATAWAESPESDADDAWLAETYSAPGAPLLRFTNKIRNVDADVVFAPARWTSNWAYRSNFFNIEYEGAGAPKYQPAPDGSGTLIRESDRLFLLPYQGKELSGIPIGPLDGIVSYCPFDEAQVLMCGTRQGEWVIAKLNISEGIVSDIVRLPDEVQAGVEAIDLCADQSKILIVYNSGKGISDPWDRLHVYTFPDFTSVWNDKADHAFFIGNDIVLYDNFHQQSKVFVQHLTRGPLSPARLGGVDSRSHGATMYTIRAVGTSASSDRIDEWSRELWQLAPDGQSVALVKAGLHTTDLNYGVAWALDDSAFVTIGTKYGSWPPLYPDFDRNLMVRYDVASGTETTIYSREVLKVDSARLGNIYPSFPGELLHGTFYHHLLATTPPVTQ